MCVCVFVSNTNLPDDLGVCLDGTFGRNGNINRTLYIRSNCQRQLMFDFCISFVLFAPKGLTKLFDSLEH